MLLHLTGPPGPLCALGPGGSSQVGHLCLQSSPAVHLGSPVLSQILDILDPASGTPGKLVAPTCLCGTGGKGHQSLVRAGATVTEEGWRWPEAGCQGAWAASMAQGRSEGRERGSAGREEPRDPSRAWCCRGHHLQPDWLTNPADGLLPGFLLSWTASPMEQGPRQPGPCGTCC